MTLPPIETVAAKVHEAWVNDNRKNGITTRISSVYGEEQMVPYEQLSESIKEYDRQLVRTVYAAIEASE